MLQTNISQLVKISVLGEIANPAMPGLPASPYLVAADGTPLVVPTFGGLVYNVRIGDRAMGWTAELIQPGVSIKHANANTNTALGVFACLGNRARVVGGAAAGAVGVVTGKSGRFAEHVICHFAPDALEKMAPGDKVQVFLPDIGMRTYTPLSWETRGATTFLAYVHGDTPGATWAKRVKAGDEVSFFGPRIAISSENECT